MSQISFPLSDRLLSRLSERAHQALIQSAQIAACYSKNRKELIIEPIHLLYALVNQKGSLAKTIMRGYKISPQKILGSIKLSGGREAGRVSPVRGREGSQRVSTSNGAKKKGLQSPPSYTLAPKTENAVKRALVLAQKHNQPFIGTEHLLVALLEAPLLPIPKDMGAHIKKQVDSLLKSSAHFPPYSQDRKTNQERAEAIFEETGKRGLGAQRKPKTSILKLYCEDLTEQKERNSRNPLVGREKELERLTRILLRRTKNNPLLVGEPGVGKTAIVYGLAQKIAEGSVPPELRGKKVLALDLSSLIAGTMFRGEFESRMRDLLNEAKSQSVILFIDELHAIMGAGAAQGSLDAANILKPVLARGEIKCIGATTFEEYKKHIENDGALKRRFQYIAINEETVVQSLETLRRLKHLYEEHHGVRIEEDAVLAAVTLSARYIQGQALPDKALDLLDEAASNVRQKTYAENGERKSKTMALLDRTREKFTREKEDMIVEGKYEEALKIRDKARILAEDIAQQGNTVTFERLPSVDAEAVAEVLAQATGIPVARLNHQERARFLNIERELADAVVGQDEAVKTVAKVLRRNKAGIGEHGRPLGSFLFVGPSGVGKTELAKALARLLSGKNERIPGNLITLDMSEYGEAHNVSRLVGAPPGYIGHEDGGQLTDKIRRNPYSVVLFDEIEKAHPQVLNVLLQILEEGALTDGRGTKVSFAQTVVVLTSNAGTEIWSYKHTLGFAYGEDIGKKKEYVSDTLKELIRPEILNRLDHVVLFEPLAYESIEKIADIQLQALKSRIENERGFSFTSELAKFIAKRAMDEDKGARGVRKIITGEVEPLIAEYILKKDPEHVAVSVKGNRVLLKDGMVNHEIRKQKVSMGGRYKTKNRSDK